MPPKPFLVLSQRTYPIHYFSLKLMFWVVPCHFVAALDTLQKLYRGTFNAWVYASRTVSCFFLQQTCPIHYFRSKTQVLDDFMPFYCRTRPAAKISIGVHLKHEFVPRKPFLFSRNEHAQSTTWGLKLMFTILLDTSMQLYIAFDDSKCR